MKAEVDLLSESRLYSFILPSPALTSVNSLNPSLAVHLGKEIVLAPGQTQKVMPCSCMWGQGLAQFPPGRPGSVRKAQHGGIGTESSRPRCDRDMRTQLPDTIKHRAFAAFANKPTGHAAETAARKQTRQFGGR